MRFNKESHKESLRTWLSQLVALPTYRKDGSSDDEEFKSAIEDGFEWLEGWADQRGFSSLNWNDKVLEIRGGDGPELGLAVHLDVVPYNQDDWSVADPGEFHVVDEEETVFYGRGVMDDKGPLAAILLSLDQLRQRETIPVSFRLVIDSAEEVGLDNLRSYFRETSESQPESNLVADGFFPMVAGEKGLLQVQFDFQLLDQRVSDKVHIQKFFSGDAINQVPGQAEVELELNNTSFETVKNELDSLRNTLSVDVSLYEKDPNTLNLELSGDTAHASTPTEGLNAASSMIELLTRTNSLTMPFEALFDAFSDQLIHEDGRFLNDASGFDLENTDERFQLGNTSNLGKINYSSEQDSFTISFDFRLVPGDDPDTIFEQLENWGNRTIPEKYNWNLHKLSSESPLTVDLSNPLPSAAIDGYEAVRGSADPIYMGGRTHAAVLENAFAFGCMELDRFESYGFHGVDERVTERELLESAEIFTQTIQNYASATQG